MVHFNEEKTYINNEKDDEHTTTSTKTKKALSEKFSSSFRLLEDDDEDVDGDCSIEELWYSQNDFDSFRRSAPCQAKAEAYRRQFIQSLLEQQSEHKTAGIEDPKGLRMMSKTCSKSAAVRARQAAVENEKDASDFQVQMEKNLSKCTTKKSNKLTAELFDL